MLSGRPAGFTTSMRAEPSPNCTVSAKSTVPDPGSVIVRSVKPSRNGRSGLGHRTSTPSSRCSPSRFTQNDQIRLPSKATSTSRSRWPPIRIPSTPT